MKKALLMLALIAGFASCKKDYPAVPTLNGTWELHSVTGGFGPGTEITEDKKDKYVITTNSRYVRTDANKVETSGEYTIKFIDEYNGYRHGTITFTNPKYSDAIALKADTMLIGSSAADGPTYKYIRIKK